jgi:hypothetical protein
MKELSRLKEILKKAKELGKITPIQKTQEEIDLEKGMDNSGLGGVGSVKAGAVKPSISKMPKPGNNSPTLSVNVSQPSKKNPMKQAEQTQNKDIKDVKMKEAQAHMKGPTMVKFEKNGQWSLNKMESATNISYDDSSDKVVNGATVNQAAHRGADINIANKQPSEVTKGDFDGRDHSKGSKDEANMAQRKAKNLEGTGIHAIPHIKKWGKKGASAVNDEVKKLKSKSKKNPVKEFNAEEIAAYNAANKKEGK